MSGKVVIINGKRFVVGTSKIKSTKIRTNVNKTHKKREQKRKSGCIGRKPKTASRKRRS